MGLILHREREISAVFEDFHFEEPPRLENYLVKRSYIPARILEIQKVISEPVKFAI